MAYILLFLITFILHDPSWMWYHIDIFKTVVLFIKGLKILEVFASSYADDVWLCLRNGDLLQKCLGSVSYYIIRLLDIKAKAPTRKELN